MSLRSVAHHGCVHAGECTSVCTDTTTSCVRHLKSCVTYHRPKNISGQNLGSEWYLDLRIEIFCNGQKLKFEGLEGHLQIQMKEVISPSLLCCTISLWILCKVVDDVVDIHVQDGGIREDFIQTHNTDV